MPKISVIMATYNCADTLCRAVDSIIQQSFQDWEFVICDDCSTDETWPLLQEYSKNNPGRFILVRNPVNSKLPYSLNQCIKNASGEYIARMDSDDISRNDRFEKQVEFLDKHHVYSVVGSDMKRFDENGPYDVYHSVAEPSKWTLLKEVPFCHATIMMRKSAYDAIGGYVVSKRTERGQDLDMWFRFYAAGFVGENIHEPLYEVYEGRNALKRRRFKYALYASLTKIKGFHLLKFPIDKYFYAISPLVSYFVPRKLKLALRK